MHTKLHCGSIGELLAFTSNDRIFSATIFSINFRERSLAPCQFTGACRQRKTTPAMPPP
jgi:hypothetical protein